MSQPIIITLQEIASNNDCDINELLRKSLIVATKLNLTEFKEWILCELNGYKDESSLPYYRVVKGQPKAEHPTYGLVSFAINNAEIAKIFDRIPILESIESLQHIIHSHKEDYSCIYLSSKIEAILMQRQSNYYKMRPIAIIPNYQLNAIIGTVKTKILETALQLESKNVIGDGIIFSNKEKEIAMNSNVFNIENFSGMIGNINGNHVNQTNTQNIEGNNFQSLSNHLKQQGISDIDIENLKNAIDSDPKPEDAKKFGNAVSNWIGQMISKAASGGWQVGIAAAGNLLSEAITKYYGS